MKTAIVGAGSSVGRYLLEKAPNQYVGIYRTSRSLSQLCDLPNIVRLCRAESIEALTGAMHGCDTVIVAVNSDNPLDALRSLKATVKACVAAHVRQIVYLSSATVHSGGQFFPQRRTSIARLPSWSSYIFGKRLCERYLASKRLGIPSVVILRPGLIWGRDMAWLHSPAAQITANEGWVAESECTCRLTHISLLAHSIDYFKATRPSGSNICDVFDAEVITWREYYKRIARVLGKPGWEPRIIYAGLLPVWLRSIKALRYTFPTGVMWSILPDRKKQRIKNIVLPISASHRRVYARVVRDGSVPPALVDREQWELKTCCAHIEPSAALREIWASYSRSPDENWNELSYLARIMM